MSTDLEMAQPGLTPASGELSEVCAASLTFLGDVPLSVTAELDRRTISVRELLQLEVNHVLLLSRPAGENIDVFAGNIRIATAEILSSEERLAVRIADLLGHGSAI